MKKYLDKLTLSKPTGSIVEPFSFDTKATTELQKWLNEDQIDALQGRAEISKQAWNDDQDAPMLAEERLVLQRAGELASAFATILEQAPPRASAELDLVFQTHLGGWQQREVMQQHLTILADSLEQHLGDMPTQDHRKSPVFFVSQIAEVLNAAGIKTSVTENSRFFKICAILFKAIGIYSSPAGTIRAFMKSRGITAHQKITTIYHLTDY